MNYHNIFLNCPHKPTFEIVHMCFIIISLYKESAAFEFLSCGKMQLHMLDINVMMTFCSKIKEMKTQIISNKK